MANGYGIDSINALGSDPMFVAALQAYNPNFRGTQQVAATDALYVQKPEVTQSQPVQQVRALQADYTEEDSNALAWIGGAVGASALLGGLDIAFCKGKHLKKIGNSFKGKAEKAAKAAEAVTGGAKKTAPKLEEMKVVREGDKFVYYIPGKTEDLVKPNDIANRLKDNPILEHQLKSLRLTLGETKITKGTYTVDGNRITFEGDKIVRIENSSGNPITDQFVENGKIKTSLKGDDATFASKVDDYLGYIRSGDTEIIHGKDTNLTDITYVTTIGDNIATVFRKALGKDTFKDAKIKSLTTLKKLDRNSEEVLAHQRISRKNGKNIDVLTGDTICTKKKLPDGYKVGEFMLSYDNKKFKVVNGEVKEIIVGNKHYKEGQDFFEAYMEKDSKAKTTLADRIKGKLKDGQIPDGATIVPV